MQAPLLSVPLCSTLWHQHRRLSTLPPVGAVAPPLQEMLPAGCCQTAATRLSLPADTYRLATALATVPCSSLPIATLGCQGCGEPSRGILDLCQSTFALPSDCLSSILISPGIFRKLRTGARGRTISNSWRRDCFVAFNYCNRQFATIVLQQGICCAQSNDPCKSTKLQILQRNISIKSLYFAERVWFSHLLQQSQRLPARLHSMLLVQKLRL